ncbi:MAG: extracellular solute-binding protein [Gammaproteobacteria bacterium]|jgi:spermidine/putrescine transport system substrate-binding protein|nr:extracellular solute-binding protein [Gammaproteobacteria bacterium]
MQKDQIIEELATGRMSRRQFNQKLIALGATMVTIPLGSKMANAGSDDHPTVFTWEGWEVPELHQPYIGKHGQSPNFAIFGDEEEAFAKMRAGFKVDLTQPCSYKVPIWKDAGILQPMDPSRLSNWSDIIPALKTIPGTFDGDKQYFIPTDWGLTSVLYRADLAPEYVGNETWGMLWDPKYKGRLSMADSLIDGVMVAAIYIGAKDPFNMTDAEMEKTRASLKEQLPLMRYYWTSPADIEQALASGELIAASAWNSSYAALKKEGLDVRYTSPKEGAMTWVCGFCLMTDHDPAKLDKIYEYVDAYASVESGVFALTEYGYGHGNMKAFAQVEKDQPGLLKELGYSTNVNETLDAGIFQAPMGNEPALQAMFEEVKAGL